MKLDDGMNYDWTPLQQVLCTMLSKIAKKVSLEAILRYIVQVLIHKAQ